MNPLTWGDPPLGLYSLPLLAARTSGTLDAQVTSNLTGADYTEELLHGRYDIAHIGTPPLITAIAQGAPYRVLARGAYELAPFYLLTGPGPARGRSAQLRVAVNKARTCPHSVLASILSGDGRSLSDIELITLVTPERMLAAAREGAVDAVVIWEPFASQLELELGWRVTLDASTLTPSSYAMVLCAHQTLLAGDPARVQRVLQQARGAFARATREQLVELWRCFPGVQREAVDRGLQRELPRWLGFGTSLDHELMRRAVTEVRGQWLKAEPTALTAERLLSGALNAS